MMSPRIPYDPMSKQEREYIYQRLDALNSDIHFLGIFACISIAMIAGTMFVLYLLLSGGK